jgi:hypothetical protein
MLPWLLPLGVLTAVLVTAVANSVVLGILFMLVGSVGVPLALQGLCSHPSRGGEHGHSA